MTKSEFETKFSSAYKKCYENYAKVAYIKEKLHEYDLNQDGKLSSEEIAAFAFIESTEFNRIVLKSVLEEILEFDEQ